MFNFFINNNENNFSLIDNENEIEILNESFARKKKFKIIKLNKQNKIKFVLKNDINFQILKKTAIVDLKIENHKKKLTCYLIKIKNCIFILKNEWLRKHNSKINWKKKNHAFFSKMRETEMHQTKNNDQNNRKKQIEKKFRIQIADWNCIEKKFQYRIIKRNVDKQRLEIRWKIEKIFEWQEYSIFNVETIHEIFETSESSDLLLIS